MSVTTATSDWLFKMDEQLISNPLSAWTPGETGTIHLTECSKVRADGYGHGEPHWLAGDRVLFATLHTGLCFAIGEIVVPSDWNNQKFWWEFTREITVASFDDPVRLSDYGVVLTQGTRQGLDPATADKIETALRANIGLPVL